VQRRKGAAPTSCSRTEPSSGVANAFVEEADGLIARLSVTLPSTCGPEVVEQHLEHFAVEFRNWILAAAAEGTPPAGPGIL
jgi:hypothetical protein